MRGLLNGTVLRQGEGKMERIAVFERVSFGEFSKGFQACFPESDAASAYESICLPRRATAGSAGYDFFLPADISLSPGEGVKVPTGIRARMDEGWALMLFPRSGLGFKYRLQLDNTVGVVDSDYYDADNEGHIFIKLTNDSREGRVLTLKAGEAFAQGIFLPFGITEDDAANAGRTGGFGSTSGKG